MKRTRRSILVITPYCPFPVTHGGAMALYYRLRELSRHHEIHLVCADPESEAREQALSSLSAELTSVTFYRSQASRWAPSRMTPAFLLRAAASSLPSQAMLASGHDMTRAILSVLHARRVDAIHCEHCYTAAPLFLDHRLRNACAGRPVLVTEQNVEHRVLEDQARFFKSRKPWRHVVSRLDAAKMKRLEERIYPRLRAVSFIASTDMEYQRRMGRRTPMAHTRVMLPVPRVAKKDMTPSGRIFFGSTLGYFPNIEGLGWFYEQIWPRVRASVPQASLHVRGSVPPFAAEPLLAASDLRATGPISHEECDARMVESDVLISPVRLGGGIKMKNVLALGMGMPLVATERSMEGIEAAAGVAYLAASEASAFADAVVRVLTREDWRERLSESARRAFLGAYTPERAIESWLSFYEEYAG